MLNEFAWWGEEHREKYIRRYEKFLKDEEELEEAEEKKNGKASLCVECKECLEKCPQQINIPEVLKKIKKIFEEGKKLDDIFEEI